MNLINTSLILACACCTFASISSQAAWHTVNSKVKIISTYGHTNTILFALESAGKEVSLCSNKTTFAIATDMEQDRKVTNVNL